MSLLVNDSDRVEITIFFSVENGAYTFYEKKEDSDTSEEKFFFRKPNWMDHRRIASLSMSTNMLGQQIVDPYRFMDARIKTLLKSWTLKGEDGDILPVTPENIDKMEPSVVEYVLNRLAGLESNEKQLPEEKNTNRTTS